eukprot:scaffold104265_cov29-Tisochrysis_lutea.AAC.2
MFTTICAHELITLDDIACQDVGCAHATAFVKAGVVRTLRGVAARVRESLARDDAADVRVVGREGPHFMTVRPARELASRVMLLGEAAEVAPVGADLLDGRIGMRAQGIAHDLVAPPVGAPVLHRGAPASAEHVVH